MRDKRNLSNDLSWIADCSNDILRACADAELSAPYPQAATYIILCAAALMLAECTLIDMFRNP